MFTVTKLRTINRRISVVTIPSSRVSPGDHPLAKKPEDSLWVQDWRSPKNFESSRACVIEGRHFCRHASYHMYSDRKNWHISCYTTSGNSRNRHKGQLDTSKLHSAQFFEIDSKSIHCYGVFCLMTLWQTRFELSRVSFKENDTKGSRNSLLVTWGLSYQGFLLQ